VSCTDAASSIALIIAKRALRGRPLKAGVEITSFIKSRLSEPTAGATADPATEMSSSPAGTSGVPRAALASVDIEVIVWRRDDPHKNRKQVVARDFSGALDRLRRTPPRRELRRGRRSGRPVPVCDCCVVPKVKEWNKLTGRGAISSYGRQPAHTHTLLRGEGTRGPRRSTAGADQHGWDRRTHTRWTRLGLTGSVAHHYQQPPGRVNRRCFYPRARRRAAEEQPGRDPEGDRHCTCLVDRGPSNPRR
jgi:hypothetical protein